MVSRRSLRREARRGELDESRWDGESVMIGLGEHGLGRVGRVDGKEGMYLTPSRLSVD
jgi:hypothetical protein